MDVIKSLFQGKVPCFSCSTYHLDLITPEDAITLMELAEIGKMAISEAYKIVGDILAEQDSLTVAD